MPTRYETRRAASLDTPIGPLTVIESHGVIVAVDWGRAPPGDASPVLQEAIRQLAAYFDGSLTEFDLPLAPDGSPFERSVWRAMEEIPFGETRTYGDLAKALDSVPRAVGRACGTNPIPVIIPCHRVVGASGKLTGYSGQGGIATKQTLLDHEGLFGPAATRH